MEIRQSDRIAALLTYGVLRPVVLIPKQTDWTDETRLKVILTHEFVHIRRFDTLTKLLLAAALCIHWFNPFVWVMYVLANRDIELSCDETVVRTDFDARNIEELKNPPMQATSVDESSAADNSSTAQELPDNSLFSGYTYAAETGPKLTPDEYAKLYAVYEPFGLTYDKKQDCFYYNGKLVRQFVDVLASNGESFSGGKFKGSMRQLGSPDGENEIEAVRDYTKLDANGYGTLIGIEVVK